jgi:hypothetical protein
MRGSANDGFAGVGWIVLFVIAFGLYSGYAFLTVPITKGNIERAVSDVLDDVSHKATDDSIRVKILRRAEASQIELYEDDIWVERESQEGERTVHVGVDYPVTVDYLGAKRTVDTSLQVTKVYRVNEAALARQAAAHERMMERNNEAMEIAGRWNEKVVDELDRCRKATGGRCDYSVIGGGGQVDPDEVEIQRFYPGAERD